MKNNTHYLFSLGFTNLYGMLIVEEMFYSWIIMVLSTITSLFSLVPNIIDRYVNVQYENEGVLLTRNRHPLTHSPWTVFYFLPFLYLGQKSNVTILEVVITLFTISWLSHLLVDSLNPGGLPLGKLSVFSNHPVKHYKFHWTLPRNTKRIRIGRIPFNDPRANKNLGYLGLFFFSLNCARMFLSLFWSY